MGKSSYCLMCGSVKDIPLFSFPRNPARRVEWKKFCQVNFDRGNMKICAKHFLEDDILTNHSRVRLKSGAIPQLLRNKVETPNRPRSNNKICFLCDVKDSSRTYFRFPKELERRWEWLKICGYPSLEDAKCLGNHTFLCEIHFRKEDIRERISVNGKNQLQPNAIPRLHLKNTLFDSDDEAQQPNNADSTTIEDNCNFEIVTVMINEEDQYVREISNESQESLTRNNENNEIIEGIADSSTITSMQTRKKRMSYLGDIKETNFASTQEAQKAFQVAKQEVLKCRRKIRVLNGKINYLRHAVTKYKSIIKDLKEKAQKNDEWF